MSIANCYNKIVRNYFMEFTGEEAPVFMKPPISFSFFNDELIKAKKRKITKSFHVKSITQLESNIPLFVYAVEEEGKTKAKIAANKTSVLIETKKKIKEQKSELKLVESTGIYHVIFSEKDKEYHCIYLSHIIGYKLDVQNFICCQQDIYKKILNIKKQQKSKQLIPKFGIYTGSVDQAGTLKYISFENQISSKPIIHSIKNDILTDIEYFFSAVPILIKEGEKGTRKVLIAGVQGTGKSSLINEIVLKYKNTHCVMIATELNVLAVHQQLCGKYSIPCLSILEDCENFFDDYNSNILNFLSGALESMNNKGSYTIFTSNHPDKISDRIKFRPERIDDVFILSALSKKDSYEVFVFYFSKFLTDSFNYKSIVGMFEGYTGAEIMKLASDVKKEAAYEYKGEYTKINKEYILKVFNKNNEKYKKLQQINTAKVKTLTNSVEKIGFNPSSFFIDDGE